MYIKQIIIKGFKSYREETPIEPFDKRHNVVVGKNGSGKSNFFKAIQFVLGNEFVHLSLNERQSLLHEGTGNGASNAFVEIIFDNSDNRIPINETEVSLRRTITSKNDQYLLNGERVTRKKVMDYLETAGFAQTNPYYIVKQGQINEMATAPDAHRLKILFEIVGIRLFDDRKKQSLEILTENDIKLAQISDFLTSITERLSALESDQIELKEYKILDKSRRSIEYLIYEIEIKRIGKILTKFTEQQVQSKNALKQLIQQFEIVTENLNNSNKNLKEFDSNMKSINSDFLTHKQEQQQLIEEKIKLELNVNEIQTEISTNKQSCEKMQLKLKEINEKTDAKQKQFDAIQMRFELAETEEINCADDLAKLQQQRKRLVTKQGRPQQFTTQSQRDHWIQSNLYDLNKQISEKFNHQTQLESELNDIVTELGECQQNLQIKTNELNELSTEIDKKNEEFYAKQKDLDEFHIGRNQLWRSETKLIQTIMQDKESLSIVDNIIRLKGGKPALNGYDSVRKVLEIFCRKGDAVHRKYVEGYYGTIIENFQCDPSIYRAVDVTIGGRLFYHIVDNDKTCSAILAEISAQQLPGEITFLPLNRLFVRNYRYPSDDSQVVPILSQLEYDEKLEIAFRHVFGRTLLCANIERATILAKSNGLDCVTIDGDLVLAKGIISGGYNHKLNSRLENYQQRKRISQQINSNEVNLNDLRTELKIIDANILTKSNEIQKCETMQMLCTSQIEQIQSIALLVNEQIDCLEHKQQTKKKAIEQCAKELNELQLTFDNLKHELKQDLDQQQFSSNDQQRIDQLNEQIRSLTEQHKEFFRMRIQLAGEKQKINNFLKNNLSRLHIELTGKLSERQLPNNDRKRKLNLYQFECNEIDKRLCVVEQIVADINEQISATNVTRTSLLNDYEIWQQREKDIKVQIDNSKAIDTKLTNKVDFLTEKLNEKKCKYDELGVMPAIDPAYLNKSVKQLFKLLDEVNDELKNYTNINKKANDQFDYFTKQTENLHQRHANLIEGQQKIHELINHLDSKKIETIDFTFNDLAQYFSEIFHKLVPNGCGRLILVKREADTEANLINAHDFIGIGVKVSFVSSNEADMCEIRQFSGGQKTLVALALIFAIQKFNPAPFYMFDEIDQALDIEHRKAIADMIHEFSENAQFIMTTFRSELVNDAHKCYGVRVHNKVSYIDCISKDQAKKFVEETPLDM